MGGPIFVKTQAMRRIPIMINLSKAASITLRAIGIMQSWSKWSQRGWPFHCYGDSLWCLSMTCSLFPLPPAQRDASSTMGECSQERKILASSSPHLPDSHLPLYPYSFVLQRLSSRWVRLRSRGIGLFHTASSYRIETLFQVWQAKNQGPQPPHHNLLVW